MERNNQQKYKGPERRKHKRLKVFHLSVPVQIKTNTDDTFLPGILLDISPGGIGILSFKDIPVGTTVKLSLSLHNINTDLITAKVVWVKKQEKTYRVGFQFIDITKNDFDKIDNFVKEHIIEDM